MSIESQAIGLAGVFQAVGQVLLLAREGRWEEPIATSSLASVLRLDAADAEAVFGSRSQVAPGLAALRGELDDSTSPRDFALTRTVATVLRLERRLQRSPTHLARLRTEIEGAQRSAEALGPAHDTVVERLAAAYADTLSTLRPRVMVHGNGLYLSQPRTVARIRALLLAAVRAAVLWRQMGGAGWRLILQRRQLLAVVRALHPA